MTTNSDKAWASVLRLRSRATAYLVTAIVTFIIGLITLLASISTMLNNLGYSQANDAAGWVIFGIVMLSISSTASIAWLFTATMANHGEVVYFSSSSNKERKEEVTYSSTVPSMEAVIDETYGTNKKVAKAGPSLKCSDCGVLNEAGKKYCKVCGGILS